MADYQRRKYELLGGLTGTVLEIGAGQGANFRYLPSSQQKLGGASAVTWIGLEPDRHRHEQLARIAARHGYQRARILGAPAEQIPLADRSVDAVFATMVLCSVADQDRVLAEIRRVLRRGGRYVFFEHVAAPRGTWLRRLQGWWAPFSRRFDCGCDPTRETWRAIEDAGFARVDFQWYTSEQFADPHGTRIAGTAYA
jgi:ubiquinone/menaquinone biosynthesis C-methylase UbiE